MKGFLSRKNLEYEERDITTDEKAQQELMGMGFTAVPVTVVGDAPPILGSNVSKIEEELAG